MKTDLKQNYLNKKYAEHDDEVDVPYIHKRPKRKAKKSDHKHEYENCVVIDSTKDSVFTLVGRCKICGKIGYPQDDKRIERKFPNVKYKWVFGVEYGHEEEYEKFMKWCKNNYTVYDIPNFDLWKTKYI